MGSADIWPNDRFVGYLCAEQFLRSTSRRIAPIREGHLLFFFFFFTLVTGPRRSLSLKLSDTRVYEPQIRALLGTASHFCEVIVLKLRTEGHRVAGDSNYHGARPVHLIITMIQWIRTSRLSIKNSLSLWQGHSSFYSANSDEHCVTSYNVPDWMDRRVAPEPSTLNPQPSTLHPAP